MQRFNAASGDFAQALASISGERSTRVAATEARSSAAGATPADLDFSIMTPRQFSQAAQSLYDDGKIDLDGLFQMQWMSGGTFKDTLSSPAGASYAAAANDSTGTRDFVKLFQDRLAFLAGSGASGGHGSTYSSVEKILGLISR